MSLEIVYKYRITREMLSCALNRYEHFCLPYSMLNEGELCGKTYLQHGKTENIFQLLKISMKLK